MNHPDDLTLQSLHDGDLDAATAAEITTHAQTCDACAGRLAALRSLSNATQQWAEAVPALPDDFADLLMTKLEAPAASAPPTLAVSAPSRAPAKVIPLRRWAFPAMAVAAAALIAVGVSLPKGPRASNFAMLQAPIRVGDGAGGVKVTRVDVPGSYTVMQLPGVRPDSLTAVVWIQGDDNGGSQ